MSRVAAIVAVLAGFGLGVGAGWLAFSDGDDGPPCWQVQAAPRPAPEDASHAEVTVQPTEHG